MILLPGRAKVQSSKYVYTGTQEVELWIWAALVSIVPHENVHVCMHVCVHVCMYVHASVTLLYVQYRTPHSSWVLTCGIALLFVVAVYWLLLVDCLLLIFVLLLIIVVIVLLFVVIACCCYWFLPHASQWTLMTWPYSECWPQRDSRSTQVT